MLLDRVFVAVTETQLKSLLLSLSSHLGGGLTAIEVAAFCAKVADVAPDDDVLIELAVCFQGAELPFVLDVFKDDEGALEAVFLLVPMLTSLVQKEASSHAGPAAVRSILGEQTTAHER